MDRYLIKPGNNMKRKSTEEKDGGDTDKKLIKDSCATGFAFVQKKGDLFSCPDRDALAHCVSADFIMGKGIAVLFKQKFGGVQELKQQYRRPGSVAVLLRGPRFVYYLVTKERVRDKPTYENMQLSLEAMRRHCVENKVESVSMPRIGSGLDGLDWARVSDIIKQVFSETDTKINVYTL